MVELQQRLVETWTEFQQSIVGKGEVNKQWHDTVKVVNFAQREVTSNTSYKK